MNEPATVMTQEEVRAKVAALSAFVAPRRESPWRRVLRSFVASRTAMFGLGIVVLLMLAALAAPWLTPQNPYDLMQLDVLDARLPPGSANGLGTFSYWLGTDGQGRDLYSGILYGLRISIGIGVGSALLAGVIGTLIGLLSAYVGGKVDSLLMRLADLVLSFPSILVSMLILAYLGKGIFNVMATLVVLEWAYYARTARGLGVSGWHIMVRHILPNCLPPLIVIGALQIARAITLEATLSFLGLGVPITEPSLGLLIANGYQYMLSGEYWISFYPGIALLVVIVAINLVGDRLRDVMNPRWQK